MSGPGNTKLMHHYLLRVIEFGPQVIGEALSRIPEEDWDRPTGSDRFSPREVLAHLRYWEPVSRFRLETAASGSGSEVPNWDEEEDVLTNDYAAKDPRQMLAEWMAERAKTTAYIQSVPAEKHSQYVIHGMWGQITFNDLANLVIAHDMYHIEQLAKFAGRSA